MLSSQLRSLAFRATVTAVLVVAAVVGLSYSGMVSNVVPRTLLFGSSVVTKKNNLSLSSLLLRRIS